MLALHNLGKLFILSFTLFQFALFASARHQFNIGWSPKREPLDSGRLLTNAARMREGLGPLKPRSFFVPSRVTARDPSTSAVPDSLTGNIQVDNAYGGIVGFVSMDIGTYGYGVTNMDSDRMSVAFTPVVPFNIAITSDGNNAPYPDLGFAGSTLDSSFLSSVTLTATYPTVLGATPQNVGNSLGGTSESAIWSYDASSGSLTALWVNPDNGQPSTMFWYSNDVISLINDPASQVSGEEVFLSASTEKSK